MKISATETFTTVCSSTILQTLYIFKYPIEHFSYKNERSFFKIQSRITKRVKGKQENCIFTKTQHQTCHSKPDGEKCPLI